MLAKAELASSITFIVLASFTIVTYDRQNMFIIQATVLVKVVMGSICSCGVVFALGLSSFPVSSVLKSCDLIVFILIVTHASDFFLLKLPNCGLVLFMP